MSGQLKKRTEIENQFKWSINDIYSTDELWQVAFDKTTAAISRADDYKETMKNSADDLLKCFNFFAEVYMEIDKIYVYAHMKMDEDGTNAFYQGLADKSEGLYVKVQAAFSFITPLLMQIDDATLKEYMSSDNGIKLYTQFVEDITRKKDHTLSEEMEQFLAKTKEIGSAAKNIFSMLNNADIKFPDVRDDEGNLIELTKGRYGTLLESTKQEVRKEAFETLYDTYLKQKNTLAATYSASVKNDIFVAKARKYKTAREFILNENNIPLDVYDNLVKTVNEHLPLMHRYVALRKKKLNLPQMNMYDLYTSIVKDVDFKYTFDEAKQTVINGLSALGDDYIANLKKGLTNGWIDVYENVGKRSGAYSWGAYGSHPFVLLNYESKLDDVFTLAHEMGHALHSYYSWETQPFIYSGYKIFIAEVASTVNEALLIEYMLKTTTEPLKRQYLINHYLDNFKGTMFRQTMFAEFEAQTHAMAEAGEALTFESLSKLYGGLNEKYYGNDVITDDRIMFEWARIPHFYNAFYVYQYATGYAAAIALSRGILDNGKPAVDKYIQFLKTGESVYSIDALKIAGIDMTSPEPIRSALALFEKLVIEMESFE